MHFTARHADTMSPAPTSGKAVVGVLIAAATAAVLTSSIYPVLIAPEKSNTRAAGSQAPNALQRRGVWDTIDKK